MLADREDIRRAQYFNGGRIVIMAEYPVEKTTDVPEHAFLKNDPKTDWDERARGLGGTLRRDFKLILWSRAVIGSRSLRRHLID